ncbi:hypothetical protein H8L32_15715 [Undibacterium sp. CY18W]|uniref:Uncharacterized protein n=1 Tax=Undibacterium hunanense TaxID=2762292 RepID=A0ABR6ZTQ1_9BURK|nr:hypothetical protein [Undibacterium hunanense]MBC3918938.1 hypothetical protein [Undibacterium hunanense]
MSVWRLLIVLSLSCLAYMVSMASMAPVAQAAVIPVTNPARVEDVQQIVRIFGIDQGIQNVIRRDLENNNRTKPETYLDQDIFMRPFTVDAINLHTSTVLAKYLSSDYAQKLLKELPKPIGKISTRLWQIEMNQNLDAAKAEFNKMPPADRKALNEFRATPTFLSMLNALRNSKDERNEELGNWSKNEMQARVRQARKSIAELMEIGLKLEKEELGDNVKLSDRITLTGQRVFDQEARLTFEYLRANIRQNLQFSEELKALDLGNVLQPANVTTRQGLENGNLTLLSAENMFDNNSKRYDSLRATYTEAMERIVMTPQQRQEIVAENKKNMEDILERRLRRNEHLRAFIELKKQVLALCESRFGKIKFEGGSLIFENDQDLNQYNGLVKQINAERQALLDVEKEGLDDRARSLEAYKKK